MASSSIPPQSASLEALGQSGPFLDAMERLAELARVNRPVILAGERGTGKELAAARLHYLSQRWQGPFVALNCAALAPSLLESELFGHEAGAFTGAVARRAGRFEAAHEGTLFLDEIAAMGQAVQEKILRVVEYGQFERLGSARAVVVDVRLVAATNADLPSLVAEGQFKPDLLDRLSFEVLTLPPLRERGEDILLLARHFAARMTVELGLPDVPGFSAAAEARLISHSWPGNVRELKNVVERAVFRYRGDTVEELVLDPFASPHRPAPSAPATEAAAPSAPAPAAPWEPGRSLPDAVRDLEVDALARALDAAKHNQRAAAELLGLTYNQFRTLYRKYNDNLK
jgi:psp operon transcriptional activator